MIDVLDETQQAYHALRAEGDRGYSKGVIESLIAADEKHKLKLGCELLQRLLEFISERNGKILAGKILKRELDMVSRREYDACSVAAQVTQRLSEESSVFFDNVAGEGLDTRIDGGVGVSFSFVGGGRDADQYYFKVFVRRGGRDYKVFRCWVAATTSVDFSVESKILPC